MQESVSIKVTTKDRHIRIERSVRNPLPYKVCVLDPELFLFFCHDYFSNVLTNACIRSSEFSIRIADGTLIFCSYLSPGLSIKIICSSFHSLDIVCNACSRFVKARSCIRANICCVCFRLIGVTGQLQTQREK